MSKFVDPRTEAEKARADLARNAEMGMAVPESPAEIRPSVTPETFGETTGLARSGPGTDGVVAGGEEREAGDSTGTDYTSRDLPEPPRRIPVSRDDDALSRAKE